MCVYMGTEIYKSWASTLQIWHFYVEHKKNRQFTRTHWRVHEFFFSLGVYVCFCKDDEVGYRSSAACSYLVEVSNCVEHRRWPKRNNNVCKHVRLTCIRPITIKIEQFGIEESIIWLSFWFIRLTLSENICAHKNRPFGNRNDKSGGKIARHV